MRVLPWPGVSAWPHGAPRSGPTGRSATGRRSEDRRRVPTPDAAGDGRGRGRDGVRGGATRPRGAAVLPAGRARRCASPAPSGAWRRRCRGRVVGPPGVTTIATAVVSASSTGSPVTRQTCRDSRCAEAPSLGDRHAGPLATISRQPSAPRTGVGERRRDRPPSAPRAMPRTRTSRIVGSPPAPCGNVQPASTRSRLSGRPSA
jgi:hypothetical protein